MALHWIIALLILGSYSSIYFRQLFTTKGTPENATALQVHIACGLSIGGFVILRIAWRLMNRPPAPLAVPAWQHLAARISHGLLYLFIIAMPFSGYGAAKRPSVYFTFVPAFRDTALYKWLVTDTLGISWSAWEKSLDFIHSVTGAYLLWPLIALHTAAALYHQFALRNGLMRRMWI